MAHWALVGPDDGGHLLAMGPLGKELVDRGHRVTMLARDKAAPLAEQFHLEFHPWDADGVPWPSHFFQWLAFRAVGLGGLIADREWLQWQNEVTLQRLPPVAKQLGIDGVLFDHVLAAGGTVAEHLGMPFVSVCTALPWNEEPRVPPAFTSWPFVDNHAAERRNRLGYAGLRWYVQPLLRRINRYRRKWKLPRFSHIDDALSPIAQISQLCPEYDFPHQTLSDAFHYVGSLTADRIVKNEFPFSWDRLDGRPLIFASLGTVRDTRNRSAFRKILAACDGLDAQLVLALGNTDEEDSPMGELGPIPGNAIVVDFAPQLKLLDRASLLITHGGVNTVLEAASRGLPVLALPRACDQLGMAARIQRAGVGSILPFQRSKPDQIRRAIERILSDESCRRRAKQLQQAMQRAGGVRRAADIAERALTTRQPVRRTDVASMQERHDNPHAIEKPHGEPIPQVPSPSGRGLG